MKWQQGPDVLLHQKCFILNFGHKQSLPYPQIKLSLESQLHLNVGTFGMNSPSKCFSVVIGGKNLELVDEVMMMVDKITEDIAMMPYAVFLMAEKLDQNINFNVSARDNMSPTMYKVPANRRSIVQFVMSCPGMSHSTSFTLHMRDNGEVDDGKEWDDLCREKMVNIAYVSKYKGVFEVDTATGELDGPKADIRSGMHSYIPYDWEILVSFFSRNSILPSWLDVNRVYGAFNHSTGLWTGAVGKVMIPRIE